VSKYLAKYLMLLPKTQHEKVLFRSKFKRGGNQTAEEASELVGTGYLQTIEQVIKAVGKVSDKGRKTQRILYFGEKLMNVKELIEELEKIPLYYIVRASHHTMSARTEYPVISCEKTQSIGCGEDEEYCLITFFDVLMGGD
jgi:hypothetical protein